MPYFMVRIRIPNGLLSAASSATIADLAERYARGIADLTVRQNVQLHWVRIEDLPGSSTRSGGSGSPRLGTCGDVTRNVTGCPLAGRRRRRDRGRLAARRRPRPRMLNGNPDFYNLPRKYKISITGCRVLVLVPGDQRRRADRGPRPATGEVGLLASGSAAGSPPSRTSAAGSTPSFAGTRSCPWSRAIAEIFRDSDVLRQNREKARLKFLFLAPRLDGGAVPGRSSRSGSASPSIPAVPEDAAGRRLSRPRRHPSAEAGRATSTPASAGPAGPASRRTQMRAVADLADRYGTGELRTTIMQNLLDPQRRRERSGRARAASWTPPASGSTPRPSGAAPSRARARSSASWRSPRPRASPAGSWRISRSGCPGFDQHVKIHVTGCPNSCGQHWIADIGIEGKKIKLDGRLVDAYYFCVGGAVGRHQAHGPPGRLPLPAAEVPDGDRAPAARVPRPAAPGRDLPRVLPRATPTTSCAPPGRRARRPGDETDPRRLARPRAPWTRGLRSTTRTGKGNRS